MKNNLGIKLLDQIASNAVAYSPVLDLRNAQNIRIQVKGAITSTPVGNFELYGSEDFATIDDEVARGTALSASTAMWTKLNIPEQAVHGSGYTAFSDVQDHVAWDGTVALNMLIDLDDPPAFVYLKWARASGGSASTNKITAKAGLRGFGG